MTEELPVIDERQRLRSPTPTPQALAWHHEGLWIGSRDKRRVYRMDPNAWTVLEETDAPGIPWAATSKGEDLWFTIGEDPEDDRYLRRYDIEKGFSETDRLACPDLTGSYLSYDGNHLYLSQWYKYRILKLDATGTILRVIDVGAEICGHVFVDGLIYVIRGTEQGEGDWRIAHLDPQEETPRVEELARVPFQCRSLVFDGRVFWTNHREAHEVVSFVVPEKA